MSDKIKKFDELAVAYIEKEYKDLDKDTWKDEIMHDHKVFVEGCKAFDKLMMGFLRTVKK